MASYNRDEARDWARDHLRGVINVVIPSFTNDLLGINEAAVRHDVRKQFEFGFDGALSSPKSRSPGPVPGVLRDRGRRSEGRAVVLPSLELERP